MINSKSMAHLPTFFSFIKCVLVDGEEMFVLQLYNFYVTLICLPVMCLDGNSWESLGTLVVLVLYYTFKMHFKCWVVSTSGWIKYIKKSIFLTMG